MNFGTDLWSGTVLSSASDFSAVSSSSASSSCQGLGSERCRFARQYQTVLSVLDRH